MFIVERAHRALGPRPPVGGTPRPILAKILNYRDRDAILKGARERGQISYKGSNISFHPDFTPAVQAARQEFAQAKKILQQAGVSYALLYPAKLKVTHKNETHFFTDAKSALKFAKHICGGKKQKATVEKQRNSENNLSDND